MIKQEPGVEELKRKIEEIKALIKLAQYGLINLFFGDEAGFSLTPYIPYGWQKTGEQTGIATKKKQIANVLGLLNPLNKQLITYATKDKEMIDSKFMIQRFTELSENIKKETVIVLDNAPWHRSKAFTANLAGWQEKGLFIFHLPPYSPHLNVIETLWRKIKYEWLRPKDYNSKTAMNKRLKEIFTSFGEHFKVNFSLNIYT